MNVIKHFSGFRIFKMPSASWDRESYKEDLYFTKLLYFPVLIQHYEWRIELCARR